MLVAGVDPSSQHIAVTVKQTLTGVVFVQKQSFPGTYSPAKAGEVLKWLDQVLIPRLDAVTGPTTPLLALEQPLVGRGGVKSTMVQAYINGLIQGVFIVAGWEVQLVNVQSWKKAIVGKGNADKEQCAERLRGVWPKAYEAAGGDQDLIDSAMLCVYAESLARRSDAIFTGAVDGGSGM